MIYKIKLNHELYVYMNGYLLIKSWHNNTFCVFDEFGPIYRKINLKKIMLTTSVYLNK